MTFWKWLIAALLLLAVAAVLLSTYGHRRWSGHTSRLIERLEAAREPMPDTRFDTSGLDDLPPPVQRYLRAALTEGMPKVMAMTIEHTGTFNMGESADRWVEFSSVQRTITHRPGFVWNGRMALLPGLSVHVHDAYVAGEGILHPAVAGLITLADLRGTDDMARGELMRYLAEAAWYPTALLPGKTIRWEAMDAHSARAELTDGGTTVALTFTFGADSMIRSVRSEARGRTVAGRIVPTPWEGLWTDYQVRDGMRVPMSGEVAWLLPEGRKPYWRGSVTKLRYEFQA